MKMDVSKFKKIRSDSKSTVLKHPRGHEIHIAHGALPKEAQHALMELPHLAEGGEAESEKIDPKFTEYNDALALPYEPGQDYSKDKYHQHSAEVDAALQDEAPNSGPAPEEIAASEEQLGMAPGTAEMLQRFPSQSGAPAASETAPSVVQPPFAGVQDRYGLNQYIEGQKGSAAQYSQGLEQERQAKQFGAQQEADVAQAGADRTNLVRDHIQAQDAAVNGPNGELANFVKDLEKGHINPNHFQENMSTKQKIGNAIALIAGGFVQGIHGGQNPGMEFLNKQIERDIDAQKANLGNKKNIFEANLQRYKNSQDATAMTAAMDRQYISYRFQQAIANAKSPESAAEYAKAKAQWDMGTRNMLQPLIQRQAIFSAKNSGVLSPEESIAFLEPDLNKQKIAGDQLQAVKDHANQRDIIFNDLDNIQKEQTLIGRTFRGGAEPPSVKALRVHAMAMLRDNEGRVNEQGLERTNDLIAGLMTKKSTMENFRRAWADFAKEKTPPSTLLRNYQITPEEFGRYDENGQPKLTRLPPVRQQSPMPQRKQAPAQKGLK